MPLRAAARTPSKLPRVVVPPDYEQIRLMGRLGVWYVRRYETAIRTLIHLVRGELQAVQG